MKTMELRFRITDTVGYTLSNAMITVFIGNKQIVGNYSPDSELYTVLVDKPNAKRFKCQIVAEGYETIHHVGKIVNELLHFNLGNVGATYVPCGNVKIPFEVDEDSIVVIGDIRKFQTGIENKGLRISRMKDKKEQLDFHVFESKAKNKSARRKEHNKSRKEIFDLSPSLETGYLVKDNTTGSSYMMTGEMRIILSKGIAPTKLEKILKEYQCVVKTYFLNQPIIQITTDEKLDIFNVIDDLIEKEIIEQAHPIIYEPTVEDYAPGNNLWTGQYSQHEINVEGAWSLLNAVDSDHKFGLGDIIIGVDDAGLAQTPTAGGGFTEHPAFDGDVTLEDGSTVPKIIHRHDFVNKVTGNNSPLDGSTHGVNVCGIALGNASPTQPATFGATGVAPNSRVISTITLSNIVLRVEAYYWLAGLKNYSLGDSLNHQTKLAEGADIIMSSLGSKTNIPVEGSIFNDWLEKALLYGRNGRGLLMIRSGGNDNKKEVYDPSGVTRLSSFDGVLSIGAVGRFPNYPELRKSVYSSFGKIDFCAPSSSGGLGRRRDAYDPPRNFKTWAATIGGKGNLPGPITHSHQAEHPIKEPYSLIQSGGKFGKMFPRATAQTRKAVKVTSNVSSGNTTFNVTDVSAYSVGITALIYDSSNSNYEYIKIATINTSTNQIGTVNPLTKNYTANNTSIFAGAHVPDTVISANVNAGASSFNVISTQGFVGGMGIYIYDSVNDKDEFHKINTFSSNTITISSTLTHNYLAQHNVRVVGLTEIEVPPASTYSINDYNIHDQITLVYIEQGKTFYNDVTIYGKDVLNKKIYVYGLPYNHEAKNGQLVDIYKNYYSQVGKGSNIPGSPHANYNPSGAYTAPLTISAVTTFHLDNGQNFVVGTFIRVTSSTTEWKRITGRVDDSAGNGATLTVDSAFVNTHNDPTIDGFPAIEIIGAFGQPLSEKLSVDDFIRVSHASEGTIYAQVLYYDISTDFAALSPIPQAIIATTWKEPFRVPGVRLNSVTGLSANQNILIGEAEYNQINHTENSETAKIVKILGGNRIILQNVRKGHEILTPGSLKIHIGELNYTDSFGGTSSACPTVAGVVALMLSANQNLTWREVVDILKKTSTKIDLNTKGFEGTPDDTTGYINDNNNQITLSPSDSDPLIRPLRAGQWMNKDEQFIFEADGTTPASGVTDTEPDKSDWYGYGMVNAEAAVQAALDYKQAALDNEDKRDLMIRDTLTDEGTTDNIGNIHSPDIWIQHTEVDYSNTNSNPKPDFSKVPPHENPKTDSDRYIYARIKNKGKEFSNLKCTVRFYIALSDGTNATGIDSPFLFPDDWSIDSEVSTIPSNTGTKQTYFIGKAEIDADKITPGGGDDFYNNDDSNSIVSVKWNNVDIPQNSTNLKTFLLVQVSPHDGTRNGSGADTNSNLSFREIAFANFNINDSSNSVSLQKLISVDEFGTLVTTNFTINVGVDIGNFTSERVAVEFIRENGLGEQSKASFRHDGTNWVLLDEDNNIPSWVNMSVPVLTGSSTPATGDQTGITFESGSFLISKLHKKFFIKVIINSSSPTSTVDIPIAEEIHEINILESTLESKGLLLGAPPLFPKSHVFADMANLTQIQDHAFGPKPSDETNIFRVTSRFTASVATNAYAMVKGKILVQPGNVAGSVNLILKPFTQPIPGFTPIKYIIYRGLKKSDFIDSSDPTKVTPKNASTNSEWIEKQYVIHENQNGASAVFLSKALGYDPAIPGSNSIDQEFFKVDPVFQLPIALRGVQLGEFDINQPFGIDIILEEGEFSPDFDFVRSAYKEIDISGISDSFLKKLEREKILNFIDPAAFYGLHVKENGIVEFRDSSNNTDSVNDIYNDVIDKFYTKNRTYIDVRNELGNSYNFFEHYNDGTVDEFNIQVKADLSGSFVAQKYGSYEWPVLMLNSISLTTSSDTFDFSFKLRADANPKPILYIEHGGLQDLAKAEGGRFVEGLDLLQTGNLETEELIFEQPNIEDPNSNGNKLNIAWFIKIHYSRQIDSSVNWESLPKALRTESYLDNVFGPVNLDIIPWTTENNIKWISNQDKKYIDASVSDFGYIAERGIAVEDTSAPGGGRVIFYASALDAFKTPVLFPPLNGLTGGTSKKASFFEEAMLFAGYRLHFDVIHDVINNVNTPITSLKLEPTSVESAPAQAMMILGLSRPEFEILKGLSGLSNKYPATAVLEEIATEPNFTKYKVGMQGLDSNGEYTKVFPLTDIVIYSTDGLLFFSDTFSVDEPLPTVYMRNAEENQGNLKRPNSIGSFPSPVKSVDAGANKFTISGDKLDYLAVNDKIVIKGSTGNDDSYTVVDLSIVSGDTVIEVSPSFSDTTVDGKLYLFEKSWEDHFIDLDKAGIISGTQPMRTIVNNFISNASAVVNDVNAESNLQTHINTYAPQILDRAREFVKNVKPDDRILYWARIKMLVALKSHPFVLQSFTARNELVKLFEELSRGYTSVDFGGTQLKKILITGFDPFSLDSNKEQGNPSGVVALSLHNTFTKDSSNNDFALIQTMIFPVRYEDFDSQSGNSGLGEGVVEEYIKKFIEDNSFRVDMIITISQAGVENYNIDRFATRTRGGLKDNLFNTRPQGSSSIKLEDNESDFEWLQTTLPKAMVPNYPATSSDPNPNSNGHWIIYNQNYQVSNDFDSNTDLPSNKIPPNSSFLGRVKKNAPTPLMKGKKINMQLGKNYLSNEIFYRVSLMRERWLKTQQPSTKFSSGHFHIAKIQSGTYSNDVENKATALVATVKDRIERGVLDLTNLFTNDYTN